jgi:tetratricopeptide (TPR) repeat protein
MKAQLLATDGRFSDALEIFNDVLERDSPENLERRKACFFADRAWCHLQLNHVELALADVERACELAGHPADPDDVASMHARVSEILKQLGQQQRSMAHKKQSIEFRRLHQASQADLLAKLQSELAGLAQPPG